MKGKLRMSPYRRAREELLSGNVATRIQAMADLEAAIRADQRRIDAEQAAFPLPLRPDGTHFYVGTYCVHLRHAECRLTCLCCGAPCQCAGCEHEKPLRTYAAGASLSGSIADIPLTSRNAADIEGERP